MSDGQSYPPPGTPPPPGAPPPSEPAAPSRWVPPPVGPGPVPTAGAPGGPAAWQPPPGMLGAAHKPGAMPLRPLGLGDIYDAAFRIIRFNPKATVGSAVIVASVTMMIPVLITALVTFTVGAAYDATGEDPTTGDDIGIAVSFLSLFGGVFLLQVGLLLVTGMVSHVTHAAAIGRRLTLGEAWAATHGKRWRLLGLMLVINVSWLLALGLWVLVGIGLALATDSTGLTVLYYVLTFLFVVLPAMAWFWIRVYYLPAVALMLEPVGVFGAIARGYRLTGRQFWRTFGIALLTLLVVGVAGNLLAFPLGIIGQIAIVATPDYGLLVLVITQALSTVVSSAFVAPFTSAVTSLQYLDQRMRKEAYDVELLERAGVLHS